MSKSKKANPKEALKQAKAALAEEDWQAASKACATVLKADPTSYLAWVMMGMSMSHMDISKSIQSYQKAVAQQPDQAPAWQGLVQLLMDRTDRTDEQTLLLCQALETLTQKALPSDHPKFRETLDQLANVYFDQERYLDAARTWIQSGKRDEIKENEEEIGEVFRKVTHALMKEESRETPQEEDKNNLFLELIPLGTSDETRESFASDYFNRIRKPATADTQEIIRVAEKLVHIVPYLLEPFEFLRIVQQDDACQLGELKISLSEEFLLSHQQSHFPRHALTYICEALAEKDLEKQQHSVNTLRSHLNSYSYGFGWLTLARIYVRMKSMLVFGAIKEGMAYAKRMTDSHPSCRFSILQSKLLVVMGEAYEQNKKPGEALKVYYRAEKVSEQDELKKDLRERIAFLEFAGQHYDKAEALLTELVEDNPSHHRGLAYLGRTLFLRKEAQSAVERLQEAIALEKNNALYFYWLAEAYWDLGGKHRSDKQFVLNNLLRSAKLDPNSSSVFYSLGRYYLDETHDQEKAERCFQKALVLNPYHLQAGQTLVRLFEDSGKHQEAITVCRGAVKGSVDAQWAWKILGAHYLAEKRYEEALNCYQAALRGGEEEDFESLEGLGTAYRQQGMFVAAMRVFERLQEREPDSLRVRYSISAIQMSMGLYEEAVASYSTVLALDASHHQARFERTQCYFMLALEQFRDGLFVRCGKSLREAAKEILACQSAVESSRRSVSHLKLRGDIFAVAFVLAEDYLLSFSEDTQDMRPEQCKEAYIQQAIEAYTLAVEASPSNGYLHYDCGVSYYQRSQQAELSQDQQTEALGKAQAAFKQAIICKPSEVKFWNALGVIETNAAIQQHIFCRALEIQPENADTWCNLMVFYLKQGEYDLASQCHQRAITHDSDHPRIWTTYALLKELEWRSLEGAARDQKQSDLDDYYSFAWESNPKSLFVKQSVAFFSRDDAMALYALNKCVEQEPSDVASWNLLGLCQEKMGHLSLACSSFTRVIELLEEQAEPVTEKQSLALLELSDEWLNELDASSCDNITWRQKNLLLAQLNKARVLCKQWMYSTAITLYDKVLPHITGGLGNQTYYYALTLFRTSRQSEAYQVLRQKGDPLALQNLSRFLLANNEKQEAYQCILEHAKESRLQAAWQVLCSVAIQMGHESVLEHLNHLKTHPQSGVADILLEVALFMRLKDLGSAKRAFARALHLEPFNPTIRSQFINFLADHFANDTKLLWQAVKNYAPSAAHHGDAVSHTSLSNEWASITKAALAMGKERNLPAVQVLLKAKRSIQQAIIADPFNLLVRYLGCVVAYALCVLQFSPDQALASIRWLNNSLPLFTLGRASSQVSTQQIVLFKSQIRLMLAEVHTLADQPEQAKQILSTLEGEDTTTADQKLEIARIRAQAAASPAEAIEILSGVSNENAVKVKLALASSYLAKEDVEAAKKVYQELAAHDCPYGDRLLSLFSAALFFYRQGDYPAAAPIVEEAYRLSGRRSDSFVLMKGAIHVRMRDWKNAMNTLQRALIINPILPLANFLLLQVHLPLRNVEASESDALYELDNNPQFDLPYIVLAYLAKVAKQSEASADFLAKAKNIATRPEIFYQF